MSSLERNAQLFEDRLDANRPPCHRRKGEGHRRRRVEARDGPGGDRRARRLEPAAIALRDVLGRRRFVRCLELLEQDLLAVPQHRHLPAIDI